VSDDRNLADLVAERRKRRSAGPTDHDRNEVVIRWVEGDLARVTDEVDAALARTAVERNTYKAGSRLVQVGWRDVRVSGGLTEPMLLMSDISTAGLLDRISRISVFQKFSKSEKDWVRASCPGQVADAYLSRTPDLWGTPALYAVVTAPTIRWDGSLLTEPGYDPATGILYRPSAEFPAVPMAPTREQCEAALGTLKDFIKTFPFETPVDRSIALAAIITSVIRTAVSTAPAFCIDATAARTGKSLFIDVASIIGTGHSAAVTSRGDDEKSGGETELEKRLSSHLLSGASVISIDNVEGQLGSSFLCSLLTQTMVSVRVLGLSKSVTCSTAAVIFLNGNNLILIGDLAAGRTLQARMDAKMASPEQRRFDHDAKERARAMRGELVAAVLTVVRGAWTLSGDEWKSMTPLGGFEEFSRMVRWPLVWLGEPDPIGNVERSKDDDPKLVALRETVWGWNKAIGIDEVTTVVGLIGKANETYFPDEGGEGGAVNPELASALRGVAGSRDGISDVRLGLWLRKNMGRTVMVEGREYRIVKEGGSGKHSTSWSLRNGVIRGDDVPF